MVRLGPIPGKIKVLDPRFCSTVALRSSQCISVPKQSTLLLVQCHRKTYLLSHHSTIVKLCHKNNNNRQYPETQLSARLLVTNLSCLKRQVQAELSEEKQGGGILPALHSPPFPLNPTPPQHQRSQPPYLIISSLCPRKNFWLCSLVL